jgi:plastocyanin
MEQTVFYVVGIALVVLAVAVSALGLRDHGFPGSRGVLVAGLGVFLLLVAATTTAAVISAREEQEHRENEEAAEAAEEAEAGQEATEGEEAETGEVAQQGAAAGDGSTLELTAPEDGSLVFDPTSLDATAGEVTIDFTNPSAVQHDVHIERDGEDLAASDLVADGESTTAAAELDAGEYAYYCAVPGHREGGMEGTLTVE